MPRRRRIPPPSSPWRPPPPRGRARVPPVRRHRRAVRRLSSSRTTRPCSRPCRSGRSTRVRRVASQRGRTSGDPSASSATLAPTSSITAAHRGGGIGVQRAHRAREPGTDAGHQRLGHRTERGGVGAADVAVPLGSGQGRQRLHQVDDVGVEGRLVRQRAEQPVQRLGQVGPQAALHGPGELRQTAVPPDLVDPGGGGRGDRGAPHRGLDQLHRVLRSPAGRPGLPEGALAVDVAPGRRDPVQVEQPQPVEQLRPAAVDRRGAGRGPRPGCGPPDGPAASGRSSAGRPPAARSAPARSPTPGPVRPPDGR